MFFWKIKLRTLLLIGFLATLIVSSGLIISFTYAKSTQSMHRISLDTIALASHGLYEKIGCVLQEIETLPALEEFFYERYPRIDLNNAPLMTFFLGILKHTPRLYTSYLGLADGSYLIAIDLSLSHSGSFLSKPLPKEAAYAVLIHSASSPNGLQTQAFFDRDCQLLSTRESVSDYHVKTRPWYEGAEKVKTLYWTNPYSNEYLENEESLSVSKPFYDQSGNLLLILGADLSFDLFSKFLQSQWISRHGRAYIADEEGKILLPTKEESPRQKEIVSKALSEYQTQKASSFSYSFQGDSYLASVQPFPTSYDKRWSIISVAPLSDFFSDLISAQQEAILISLAVMAASALVAILISIHISKPIAQIGHEIDRIAQLDLESKTRTISHIEEIKNIDSSVASMRKALRSFAHYIPKELAKELMRKDHEIALGGEKKHITIFFTDIANFTSIAEGLPIEQISALLTEYFEILTQVILDSGGTIDKYIGDSIMSIWGAPDELPNFPIKACKAALLCHKKLASLHEKRKKEKLPLFETRMGIKTGSAFVGNFGTAERMNYSAIGDAVNTAARLQALNKTYGTHIIIEEETLRATGTQFLVRPLGVVEVRGKKEKLKIYELVAQKKGEPEILPTPEKIELCTLFTQAYDLFEKGNLKEAQKVFETLHKKFPNDLPTKLYLDTF